jgi:bacterial/archaeal transporter family-2 protein
VPESILSHWQTFGSYTLSSGFAFLTFAGIAFLAGAASAAQTTMNAMLGRSIGDPVGAALWSFATGAAIVLVIYLLRGGNLSQQSLSTAPAWSLFGGAMGAAMVLSVIVTAPRIGLMTALTAIILGQAVVSMVLDATGFWGEPKAISAQRLTAIGLLIAGFWASRA